MTVTYLANLVAEAMAERLTTINAPTHLLEQFDQDLVQPILQVARDFETVPAEMQEAVLQFNFVLSGNSIYGVFAVALAGNIPAETLVESSVASMEDMVRSELATLN